MRKTFVVAFAAVIVAAVSLNAQQSPCPCVPVTHLWVADACSSWNCAASAVVLANGDGVVPFPTTSTEYPWIVLRRIASGSATVSPDAPFKVDGFDSVMDGVAAYYQVDPQLQPMLITAPDGKTLVISRSAASMRGRVVAH